MEGLPPKKIVFAFGRFQPPTIGHELLVNKVKGIAGNAADHVIYASKTEDKKKNPLPVARKLYYLKRMFPGVNFAAANDQQRTFIEVAAALNKKYKHIVMVAGSDRVANYKELLTKYNGKDFNFDSIEVISAGERDPDADDASGMSGTKMREAAKKGDFKLFKTGLPHTITDLDARRLMNELRKVSGLQPVKESLNIVVDSLREQYFRGDIFNVGDRVTCNEETFEIIKRGSNHLLVKAEDGSLHSKWIQDVTLAEDIQIGYSPKEITFGGYTTKNFHHHDYVSKAFEMTIKRLGAKNPEEVLEALKATDTYMAINDLHIDQNEKPDSSELEQWILAHDKARVMLENLGEFAHHQDYWHMHMHELQDQMSNFKETGKGEMQEELTNKTLKNNDKIKVARVIATMLGVDNAESMSSPEQLVNAGLRKVRSKTLNKDSVNIVKRMLSLADEVGIKYDSNLLQPKLQEEMAMQKVIKFREFHKKDQLRKMNRNYQLGEAELETSDIKVSASGRKVRAHRFKVGDDVKESVGTMVAGGFAQFLGNKIDPLHGDMMRAHAEILGRKAEMYARATAKKIKDLLTKNKLTKEDVDYLDSLYGDTTLLDIPVLEGEETWAQRVIDEADEKINTEALPLHADAQFPDDEEDFEDLSDDEIDAMVNNMTDDDLIEHGYDDDEVVAIDDETGEEIDLEDEEDEKVNEESLNEVLSRIERIKAKVRMRKTKAKRERKLSIALRKTSDTKTINRRARRLAIKSLKQRFARKPISKLSVAEKERLEQRISKMKPILNRIAMRMAPRVRKLERDRIRR